MDFLPQQNRRVSSEPLNGVADILAGGKHVVVIGGGDTGSDCIGTSFRQGAKSVTQLEIMAAPPEHENKALTWPNWPLKMRTSSSQAEGVSTSVSASAGDRPTSAIRRSVGPAASVHQSVAIGNRHRTALPEWSRGHFQGVIVAVDEPPPRWCAAWPRGRAPRSLMSGLDVGSGSGGSGAGRLGIGSRGTGSGVSIDQIEGQCPSGPALSRFVR